MKQFIFLCLFVIGVFCGIAQTPKFKVVTTELSRGSIPNAEYIEMLVDGQRTINDSIADLRNMVIYDTNGDSAYYSPAGSFLGAGIASGKYSFPNRSPWDSIPYGTLIVVYNDKIQTAIFQLMILLEGT